MTIVEVTRPFRNERARSLYSPQIRLSSILFLDAISLVALIVVFLSWLNKMILSTNEGQAKTCGKK
jgi:hypothetical protein